MFEFIQTKRNILLLVIALAVAANIGYRAYDRWGGREFIAQQQTDLLHRDLLDDGASLLNNDQAEQLAGYHAKILEAFNIDYRIITTAKAGDLNLFTAKRFAALKVGSLSSGGHGLLLVIDKSANRVRLEVGRSLEGSYTDGFVSFIEREQMVPFFRDSRIADGILATTELIVARYYEAGKNIAFDPALHRGAEPSTGAGASTAAQIGVKTKTTDYGSQDVSAANNTPQSVVDAYLKAMANYNANPSLPIYTDASKQMMKKWRVTKGQMRNIYNTYKKCTIDRIKSQGNYAVVRYLVNQRQCSPYFFKLEDDAWKLDLTVMMKGIRFNHKNAWRLDAKNLNRSYIFAFTDWKFDKNGFPYSGN